MQTILEAKNIHVDFKEKNVLNDVSLTVEKGKIYSIIGPNGCGKTTLLRTLTRNLKPNSGNVLLNGSNVFKQPSKQVAQTMAVLTQTHSGMNDVTVKQIVSYGRFAYKKWWKGNEKKDEDIINECIEKTSLQSFENRKINTLSGGERQRAWIAMAIAQCPKVLILDEPTTFLDIAHQLEILELVKKLNEEDGITVLMVLHDINQAARYSDELFVMKQGQLLHTGKPWDILTPDVLKQVFKVEAIVTKDELSDKPIFYAKSVVNV